MTDRDWRWDGGRPCLDLVNTLRERWRSGRELLQTPADLAAWLQAAGLAPSDATVTDSALHAARTLRSAVDSAAQAHAADQPLPAAAVDTINATVREGWEPPRLVLDTDGRPRHPEPQANAVTTALATVATDAIDLLAHTDGWRIRICASDTCGIRFLDRSPAGNRHWCSMQRCGNRAKARHHYSRRRQGVPGEVSDPLA